MKNVLVIGELNKMMHKAVSDAQTLSQYQFEYFNMTYQSYLDQEPDFLDDVYSAIKRNDIIIFSKKDSELCLKMTLAAMQICDNDHLIVVQENFNRDLDNSSSRLQSLLRISEVSFSVIQFKTKTLNESANLNIIQNKNVLTDLKIDEHEFIGIFNALLNDVSTPLLEFIA